jgi:hypothetical protein
MKISLQRGSIIAHEPQHLQDVSHVIVRMDDGTPIMVLYQLEDGSVYTIRHGEPEFGDVLAMVESTGRIIQPVRSP